MSAEFVIPDWMAPAEPPPPPDVTDVDPYRVEALVNRFIAAKQDALFTGRDAYFYYKDSDAVQLLPHITNRLIDLKNEQLTRPLPYYPQSLDQLGPESLIRPLTDGERTALGERLDAHIADAMDGINRHVAAQRHVLNRQILAERQRLIERAVMLEHTNDDKLAGLAEASASAALELARMNGEPEGPVAQAARSAIWRTAIRERIANGNGRQALALFDRVQDQLTASDKLSLDTPMQVARQDQTAEQWIANQTATDGPPLQDRVAADPNLPLDTKHIIRAKLDARDSAQESKRVATVQALDDQLQAARGALATSPGIYETGSFARIADAYAAAGEPGKAESTRRLALQESAFLSFAQASTDKQQRMVDELPPGDLRDSAQAIQRHQAEAFTRDPFAAGTALYPEVGPPAPIDDIQGRVQQARKIAQMRDVSVVPFTAGEIAAMKQTLAMGSEVDKQIVLTRLDAVPGDMRPSVEPARAPQTAEILASDAAPRPHEYRLYPLIGADGSSAETEATTTEGTGGFGGAPQPGPDPGSAEYQAADAEARRIVAEQERKQRKPNDDAGAGIAIEPAPGSPEYQSADAEARGIIARQEADQRVTDRLISAWMAAPKRDEQPQMPPELFRRLEPDQRQQLEDALHHSADVETDPQVLARIVRGITSYNSQVRLKWAREALYRFRSSLSAEDFAKVTALQNRLDPHTGRLLGSAPIPDDLQPFYDGLAPDPDAEYGTLVAAGSDGRVRVVMPTPLRAFLKGMLDLFAAEKTGELTPQSLESLATLMGLAGRTIGPAGGAETLAVGGKRPLSAQEKQRRAEQLAVNKKNGRAWEKEREAFYKEKGFEVGAQITIKTLSGLRGRVDILLRDPATGGILIIETKASRIPYIRRRQQRFFDKLEEEGGIVVGEGKGSFTGGTPIPKRRVEIERRPAEVGNAPSPSR